MSSLKTWSLPRNKRKRHLSGSVLSPASQIARQIGIPWLVDPSIRFNTSRNIKLFPQNPTEISWWSLPGSRSLRRSSAKKQEVYGSLRKRRPRLESEVNSLRSKAPGPLLSRKLKAIQSLRRLINWCTSKLSLQITNPR